MLFARRLSSSRSALRHVESLTTQRQAAALFRPASFATSATTTPAAALPLLSRKPNNISVAPVASSGVREYSTTTPLSSTSAATTSLPSGLRASTLDHLFFPNAVAVIGATDKQGSVGRTILWNLLSSNFGGTVYPINPKRPNVLGIAAHKNLASLPEKPDVAIVCTPAQSVPDVIRDCIANGVPTAIIISAGFEELGEEGHRLVERFMADARGKIRILGPNCLGLMSPVSGLNATFAHGMALKGSIGFISQSGALCTAILDWSLREKVGFSHFISIGSMVDIKWGDLLDYLGQDPSTKSIIAYMESIGNAREFISAARAVALTKPIIMIKAGRTAAAAKAAASHTGTLAGSDAVLEAAFERAGVLRVETIEDLFATAEVLAKQPLPKGKNLLIVTNAGGPGVIATDALEYNGGKLATLSAETVDSLNKFLPHAWSHGNPVDILGDAQPEIYAKTLEVSAQDPNNDGLLVILTPQDMTDPTRTAEFVKRVAPKFGNKPLFASWMGADMVSKGRDILSEAGIPTFEYPDLACRMFNYMWKYGANLNNLYQIPRSLGSDSLDAHAAAIAKVSDIINDARTKKELILTEYDSKRVLETYGIPVSKTYLATTIQGAQEVAEKIGYPVVLKIHSKKITHKSDVGGVQLNLRSAADVAAAFDKIKDSVTKHVGPEFFEGVTIQKMVKFEDSYELIIGSTTDPQFGPVVVFGAGGTMVEVFKDSALTLPPVTSHLAKNVMARTKIWKALHGVRGKPPVNIEALTDLFVRFSILVVEQPWIKELDINPLIVSPSGVIALDARVIVNEQDSHVVPAIRPYPTEFVKQLQVPGLDSPVFLRPLKPEDEPLLDKFWNELPDDIVKAALKEKGLKYLRLKRGGESSPASFASRMLCFADYDHELALVAEYKGMFYGICRYSRFLDRNKASFGVLVNHSIKPDIPRLGTDLIKHMMHVAKVEGVQTLTAEINKRNTLCINMLKKLGWQVSSPSAEADFIVATVSTTNTNNTNNTTV